MNNYKYRIDEDGFLHRTLKNTREKNLYCPHLEDNYCGDWCPLFDGPYKKLGFSKEKKFDLYCLRICENREIVLEFKDFIDEREKND